MTTLVAGIGNIFLGDDGFGVEVVSRIGPGMVPDDVEVADYGIRGVHLAYELLDGRYDTLILVDAVPAEGPPGTLVVLDASATAHSSVSSTVDAHSMSPDVVLSTLRGLGGSIDRVYVVGCRPAVVEERMGLSEPVRAAVDDAVRATVELARVTAGTGDTRTPVAAGHARRTEPRQGRRLA